MQQDNYSYKYIAGAAETQVKTGPGRLIRVIVGTGNAGDIKLIDGTSGSTTNLGEFESNILGGSYEFNCQFAAGLRVVTGHASQKVTIIYG